VGVSGRLWGCSALQAGQAAVNGRQKKKQQRNGLSLLLTYVHDIVCLIVFMMGG
jgi:hypothetical protein